MLENKINTLLQRNDLIITNQEKLKIFLKNIDLKETLFVFDFDWTITKKWQYSSFLPINKPLNVWEEYYNYKKIINNYYQTIEFAHWFDEVFNMLENNDKLLARSWITYDDFKWMMMDRWFWEVMKIATILKNDLSSIDYSLVEFKPNAKDILNEIMSKELDLLVVSAWIKNFITWFFDYHNIDNKAKIIWNEFYLDDKWIIKDYNKNIITTFTKHKIDYQNTWINTKKFAIQAWDSIWDSNIVKRHFNPENLLSIWFLNDDIKSLQHYKNHFDIILTKNDSSFDFIKHLIN